MTIADIVESKGYKKLMAKVYGWGAAVVILGALFKIQHYPGASIMLIAGLGTEAVIFFLSAFEPLHEDIDWTLVYPELAGLSEDLDEEFISSSNRDKSRTGSETDRGEVYSGGGQQTGGGAPAVVGGGGGGGSLYALERFDELLEKSNVGTELFDKLGEGLNNFSKTAAKLNDLNEASVATDEFVNNIKSASESVGLFNESYNGFAGQLNDSAQNLSDSYIKTAEAISQSGSDVAQVFSKTGEEMAEAVSKSSENMNQAYLNITESIQKSFDTVQQESSSYTEKLDVLNKNLSELNAIHELQMKNAHEQLKDNEQIYKGIGNMMQNLNESVEETKKYKEEVSKLSNNLAALNDVYGNMLSSMNFK